MAKEQIGRPPRPDDPEPVTLLLPAALRNWLRDQAEREKRSTGKNRSMGSIVEDGLRLYQAKETARVKRAGRRDRGKS